MVWRSTRSTSRGGSAGMSPLPISIRCRIIPGCASSTDHDRPDDRAGWDRVGIEAAGPEGVVRFDADRVVLAGGAYGSPVILQRSGIADPCAAGPVRHRCRATVARVGRNLMDHPAIALRYAGTPELYERRLETFVAEGGLPREEGTTALASSSRCTEIFDLHLYPIASMKSRDDWTIRSRPRSWRRARPASAHHRPRSRRAAPDRPCLSDRRRRLRSRRHHRRRAPCP